MLVASSQDVVLSIASLLKLVCSQEGAHTRIFHMILKVLASAIVIKVLVDDVECSSTLVLHTRVVFNFSLQDRNFLLLVHL